MKKILALVALALIISGCASMNKDECELANWQAIGYQHGIKGQSAAEFQQYQQDCAAHRIKADYQAFKKGHQNGLNDYCTYERGLAMGANGSAYNAMCKGSDYPNFSEGYHAGIKRYCSYERGLGLGSAGSNYIASCPANQFPTFSQGYAEGIVRYCTFDNGYALGLAGKAVNPNCPESEFQAYSDGYRLGHERFDTLVHLSNLEAEAVGLEASIDKQRKNISRAEQTIYSDESTPELRKQAMDKIKWHQQEITRLEQALLDVQRQIGFLEAKLSQA